jgi:hypothetical protein
VGAAAETAARALAAGSAVAVRELAGR